jgi:alpha-D-ribose 1-methylphosphonate 5-triphosphate synthase subunit PhnG
MDQSTRKAWMGLLAKAPADQLKALWAATGLTPDHTTLRAPEVGGVMLRGRMGGTGAPFNLGEMTVTRCSLKLAGGAVGHSYVQGRDKDKARIAALIDALMQTDAAMTLRGAILVPLETAMAEATRSRAAKAAATKVDFFTMVRGED